MRTLRFAVVSLLLVSSTLVVLGHEGGAPPPLRAAIAKAGVRTPERPEPDEPDVVALGRMLFFDKILSGDCEVSCASCHSPRRATGDGLPVSLDARGVGRERGRKPTAERLLARNTQALFNVGLPEVQSLFWDGRVARDSDGEPLEAQAMHPVVSAIEMRGESGKNDLASAADDAGVCSAVMKRVLKIREYRDLFAAAFPLTKTSELGFAQVARAIAAFERAAWTRIDTPFDRWLEGDVAALDSKALHGAELFFGRAKCASCHSGPLLSDWKKHSLAVPRIGTERRPYPKDEAFRTPPLRNVALTGPWMHDGAFTTLEAVVRHHLDPRASLERYTGSELDEPFRSTLDRDPERRKAALAALDPLLRERVALSDADVKAVVAFLEALTDPAARRPIDVPRHVPSRLPVD